jgi:hypothetical protein
VRLLALDFLAMVKQRRATAGPRRGDLISGPTVHNILTDVERFYAWMADHKDEAARALGDRRWERLGYEHTRLWRLGEKPRVPTGPDDDVYFDATTMDQLMRHAGVLAAPKEEGGLVDEQAMRILMLLARTGRRVSEILLGASPNARGAYCGVRESVPARISCFRVSGATRQRRGPGRPGNGGPMHAR